jgi:HEAT repeat protein
MQSIYSDEFESLIFGLRNSNKEFRAQCTAKMVIYGKEAVPRILPLLQDSDWIIRYRAAEALGQIHAPEAVPSLINTCSDQKDHVRYMAAKSLGLMRAPEANSILISLLTDEHPYTRGIAAEGLAAIGDITGKAGIEAALPYEQDLVIKERMIKSLNSF